jgi:hypothetical protein
MWILEEVGAAAGGAVDSKVDQAERVSTNEPRRGRGEVCMSEVG